MSKIDIDLIKQEVRSLLISSKHGLSDNELLNDYRLYNSNTELPYKQLGHSSLISLLRTWPDVCRIEHKGNNIMRILAVEDENTKHILSMVKGQRSSKRRRCPRRGQNSQRGKGGSCFAYADNHNSQPSRTDFHQGFRSETDSRNTQNSRKNPSKPGTFPHLEREISFERSQPIAGRKNDENLQASRQSKDKTREDRILRRMNSFEKEPEQQRRTQTTNQTKNRVVVQQESAFTITVSVNNSSRNRRRNKKTHESQPETQYINIDRQPTGENEYYEEYCDNAIQDETEEQILNNLQSLLKDHPHGIRLLDLDKMYKGRYNRSLLVELKLSNILLIKEFIDEFANISRHQTKDGLNDHIITLKSFEQIDETKRYLLQMITDTGIVPESYRYRNNIISYIKDRSFIGTVSEIDQNQCCFFIQPKRFEEHILKLMEELDLYYSSEISNTLIIKNVEAGLSCVTKFGGSYHRTFIQESDLDKCVIVYVDYGTTEEVYKNNQQFKYLLNHFAELPAMTIRCQLADVFFGDSTCLSDETYEELLEICKNGPYTIERVDDMGEYLPIRIFDTNGSCLNDILIERNVAWRLSAMNDKKPSLEKLSEPIVDDVARAVICPLPDSRPSTPDSDTDANRFMIKENKSVRPGSISIPIKSQWKLLKFGNTISFYLIHDGDNGTCIPCFSLSILIGASELDIACEKSLQSIRFNRTTENELMFASLQRALPSNCTHLNENHIFLFPLLSVITYLERKNMCNMGWLIEVLKEERAASVNQTYWSIFYNERPIPTNYTGSTISSPEKCLERYHSLLTRRREMLNNMLQTEDMNINASTIELTNIENELRELIKRMRLGTNISAENENIARNSESPTANELKSIMAQCKKLIEDIYALYDHVHIDDEKTIYIHQCLSFLNSSKNFHSDKQLYEDYCNLRSKLTDIIADLRQQLPSNFYSK